MSEHITHIAIYEDSARLLAISPTITEAFKISVERHPDIALMASASRGNHLYAVPFLERDRERWATRREGDGTEERIAAAIGWISHRGADLHTKPLGDILESELEAQPDLYFSTHESDVYQDAVTFREVYGGGEYPATSPYAVMPPGMMEHGMASHPASAAVDVEAIEPVFAASIQQAMIELHTFSSGPADDLDAWMEKYMERRQYYTEELGMYLDAFERPDPRKMARYIDGINWYDRDDELIRLVRSIHLGRRDTSIELAAAVDAAESQSQYAQALAKSYRFLQAASDFFDGTLEKTPVYDLYDMWEGHRF